METSTDPNLSAQSVDAEEEVIIDPLTLMPDLYNAAVSNNTEQVLKFLEMKVPPTHLEHRTGFTALHWASLNGNVIMVKKLLESGASQPYHQYVNKLKKAALAKNKKSRRPESRLTAIAETTEGEEGNPSDENKEESNGNTQNDPEGSAKMEDLEIDDDDPLDVFANNHDHGADYTQNTPLQWATQKGHLRVIWLLLNDGYSPSDIDKMLNNCLHLAAALGDVKILNILIADGTNANAVNYYKNKPIDMAKNKAVRDLLAVAMESGASMTDDDRKIKHEQNMRQYNKMTKTLEDAIAEASAALTAASPTATLQAAATLEENGGGDAAQAASLPPPNPNVIYSSVIPTISKRVNLLLSDAMILGKENALDADMIEQATQLLGKIEILQKLSDTYKSVLSSSPISTQSLFISSVYRLEEAIEHAVSVSSDPQIISYAVDLIKRCQSEYFITTVYSRLEDVVVANDCHEHDINVLRQALERGQELFVSSGLLEKANYFLLRLDNELGMYRALKNVPSIKMPMDNPPEGYYTEKDFGKVQETEGYPLPPAETGEYVWIPAENYANYLNAMNTLRSIYTTVISDSVIASSVNAALLAEAKDRITKADKELKILEAKDSADKTNAIEAVKKLAKKLKGGKKKK